MDLPKFLVVEDEEIQAQIYLDQLGEFYQMKIAGSGEECLDLAVDFKPDLVLMDVRLPGIDGYETCRRLHGVKGCERVPVVFLSSAAKIEDRLAGYAAGAQDYLVKPIVIQELQRKIELILNKHAEIDALFAQLGDVSKTVMEAVHYARECGVIMQAVPETIPCRNYQDIVRVVLKTTAKLGLECSVQVRGQAGYVSESMAGVCSSLEQAVLTNLVIHEGIMDLGQFTAINRPGISLIVKNMPRDDQERHDRIKDALSMLAAGIDARVNTLDADIDYRRQNEVLRAQLASVTSVLVNLRAQCHKGAMEYRNRVHGLVFELEDSITKSMIHCNLTQKEFDQISNSMHATFNELELSSIELPLLDTTLEELSKAVTSLA